MKCHCLGLAEVVEQRDLIGLGGEVVNGGNHIRQSLTPRLAIALGAWHSEHVIDLAKVVADLSPAFRVWGKTTQDSGNVSYGLDSPIGRLFVKTAGDPVDPTPYLNHAGRVALLRNAGRLAESATHPLLPEYLGLVEAHDGPRLVYRFRDGDHLGSTAADRDDPRIAFQRFRALPTTEIMAALDALYDLHDYLTETGWIAGDFYDGAMLYDFKKHRLTVIDLDNYRQGPYQNTMGRMFGSTRFMAPEEHTLGAKIDERTTAYVMARTAFVLLSDGTLKRSAFRGDDSHYAVLVRAVEPHPADRYRSYGAFYAAWQSC